MKRIYMSSIKKTLLRMVGNLNLLVLKDKFSDDYTSNVLAEYKSAPIMVNIGAGDFFHPLWINLDYANEFYDGVQKSNFVSHNLSSMTKFPFDNEMVDIYYCSHVAEHLSDDAFNKMLIEVYRTLKPGGIFRIVVPDIEHLYADFKNSSGKIASQISPWGGGLNRYQSFLQHFATLLVVGEQLVKIKPLNKDEFYESLNKLSMVEFLQKYINSLPADANKIMPHGHCNWFTFEKLYNYLDLVGFKNIYRSEFGKSKSIALRSLKRFDNTSPEISLYVEVRK